MGCRACEVEALPCKLNRGLNPYSCAFVQAQSQQKQMSSRANPEAEPLYIQVAYYHDIKGGIYFNNCKFGMPGPRGHGAFASVLCLCIAFKSVCACDLAGLWFCSARL